MPKFLVHKGHDAWVRCEAIVEADTIEEANEIASSHLFPGWIATGDIDEFDHVDFFPEETEQVDDDYEIDVPVNLTISPAEHATILAALRFYREIATNGDTVVSLNAEAIDELCERINQ